MKNFLKKSSNKDPELYVRGFQNGDEVRLIELFEHTYREYGGYVPKNTEYWRWCVTQRPGLSTEDILIICQGDKILAYAVYKRVGQEMSEGKLLEIAVDQKIPSPQRQYAIKFLILAIEKRARDQKAEAVDFTIANNDEDFVSVLESMGYKLETNDVLQVVIVNTILLLTQILSSRIDPSKHLDYPSLRLDLSAGHYRDFSDEHVYITFNPNLSVKSSNSEAECSVSMDMTALTNLIFRRKSLTELIQEEEIVIIAEEKRELAERVLSLLILRSDWYLPNVDGR